MTLRINLWQKTKNMKNIFLFCTILFFSCQPTEEKNILEQLISKNKKELGAPAEYPEKFELQILYTQIDRDDNNTPTFTTHKFNVNKNQYFYPASTVKMPAAFFALEKINKLKIDGLDKYSELQIDSIRPPQTPLRSDSTSRNGLTSLAHFTKKIFLVSDNDANNRLYEFLGQEYFNAELEKKGFENTQIVHRIGPSGFPFNEEGNRYTNPFTFYGIDTILYHQPEVFAKNALELPPMDHLQKGKGYMSDGKLINEPKDFSKKNRFSIQDMSAMLQAVMFPEATPEHQRFNLTEDDYQFLYKVMSMRPRESKFPKYTQEEHDSYVKFFIYGDKKERIPDHIRTFNKVGWAYGYLTDVSYIVDFEKEIEFFLTATISVNENQIFNDDNYEYKTIGLPFLSKLGKVIYDYEVQRERKVKPDLSKFKVDYLATD